MEAAAAAVLRGVFEARGLSAGLDDDIFNYLAGFAPCSCLPRRDSVKEFKRSKHAVQQAAWHVWRLLSALRATMLNVFVLFTRCGDDGLEK